MLSYFMPTKFLLAHGADLQHHSNFVITKINELRNLRFKALKIILPMLTYTQFEIVQKSKVTKKIVVFYTQ